MPPPTLAPPPSILINGVPRKKRVAFCNQRPQQRYEGTLDESRRATIALNHMLSGLSDDDDEIETDSATSCAGSPISPASSSGASVA
jgi:hypothetical protein